MQRLRHRTAVLLAWGVAIAGIGACSSGGGDESSAPAPETTTTSTTFPSETASPPTTTAPTSTAPATTIPSGVDADSLAATIVASERAIRRPGTPVGELEDEGRAQQAAYRQLSDRPELLDQVLGKVPTDLHATVRANFMATAELRAHTKPARTLPAWRIVPPAPAEELLGHYRAAEDDIGVEWEYLAAIHLVETRMGRIRGASSAGALGPMQFIPETWRRYGRGDINSNRDAIFAAARLLRANGAPDNMRRALHSYNPVPWYVNAVTLYAGQIKAHERAYYGYYHWQVYYRMVDGDRLLPVGYGS